MLLMLALPAFAMRSPTAGPRLGSLTTALATATPASADGLLAGMDATRQAKLQSMAAEADAKDLLCAGRYPWQIQDLSPWDLTFDPPCYTRLNTCPLPAVPGQRRLHTVRPTGCAVPGQHRPITGYMLLAWGWLCHLTWHERAEPAWAPSRALNTHRRCLSSAALCELQVLHLRLL